MDDHASILRRLLTERCLTTHTREQITEALSRVAAIERTAR